MIEREDVSKAISNCFDNIDNFFDAIEGNNVNPPFECFQTTGESIGNADIMIFNFKSGKYISWYKLTHIGRDLVTNIDNPIELAAFIRAFKESIE